MLSNIFYVISSLFHFPALHLNFLLMHVVADLSGSGSAIYVCVLCTSSIVYFAHGNGRV